MLLGFNVTVVTVEFFTIFASILSSAILGLFFTSFKEDKRSFLTYLVCGCIGLLCIFFTLNKSLIIAYLALIVGMILTVLFGKKIIPFNKNTKITIFCIAGLVSLIFIIFVLNALNVQPLANVIEGNAFLNKLFNTNKVIRKYHDLIRTMVDCKGYRGFTGYLAGKDSVTFSGSWLFDMIPFAQIFGWATFIIFVSVFFVRFAQYFKTSSNDTAIKILLFSVVLSFFAFTIAGYDSMPYLENSKYLPLIFIAPFVIIVFIFGYIGENSEEKIV